MRKGLATAAILVAACLVPEHGDAAVRPELPPAGPFPDAPCTLASRMDIYVGPDGTFWECVCEALKSGHVCDWYATSEPNELRKRVKARLRVKKLPRMVVIRWPA
jgi:hypothetical protein